MEYFYWSLPAMTTASSISKLHLLQPSSNFPSTPTLHFFRNPNNIPSPSHPRRSSLRTKPRCKIPFALTESDSPKALEPDPKTLLQELAESFVLPSDYFSKLPCDLRLDLNDAAFDLSNGPIKDELAMGKHLIAAGRRFQSMGAFGGGEPEKIAKVMIRAGKFLSANAAASSTDVKPKVETRTLKFGELQVELTPDKAFIGAGIGVVFGVLSWVISQGIESIPESSLQYANGNALLLAKSLRGALLVLFYSSAVLSTLASVGLVLLGAQLSSKEK